MSIETVATEETCVAIDLTTTFLPSNAMSPDKHRLDLAKGQAIVVWLQTFHFPTLYRKQGADMEVTNPGAGKLVLIGPESQKWQKSIQSSLKKIVAEDLGNLSAKSLIPTIPEIDSEGRGMHDLQETEKKLSVKIVFDEDTGHVFLVGDAKKLEKKCFVLRNILSHYHWRLSGTNCSFSK